MQRRTGRSNSVGPASRGETGHRFLIHDRDAIYAPVVERAIRSMGLRVLKTPVQTQQANCFCERLIGTRRRTTLKEVPRRSGSCGNELAEAIVAREHKETRIACLRAIQPITS